MRLFLSALEPSANIHAREVVRELLTLLESSLDSKATLEIVGVFDPSLLAELHQGAIKLAPLYHPRDFSIMGFSDVAVKIPFLCPCAKTASHERDRSWCDYAYGFFIVSYSLKQAYPISAARQRRAYLLLYLPQLWAWKS